MNKCLCCHRLALLDVLNNQMQLLPTHNDKMKHLKVLRFSRPLIFLVREPQVHIPTTPTNVVGDSYKCQVTPPCLATYPERAIVHTNKLATFSASALAAATFLFFLMGHWHRLMTNSGGHCIVKPPTRLPLQQQSRCTSAKPAPPNFHPG